MAAAHVLLALVEAFLVVLQASSLWRSVAGGTSQTRIWPPSVMYCLQADTIWLVTYKREELTQQTTNMCHITRQYVVLHKANLQ